MYVCMYVYIYIYIYICGSSDHQADTAQTGTRQAELSPRANIYNLECRAPLRSTSPLSGE